MRQTLNQEWKNENRGLVVVVVRGPPQSDTPPPYTPPSLLALSSPPGAAMGARTTDDSMGIGDWVLDGAEGELPLVARLRRNPHVREGV